MMHYDV